MARLGAHSGIVIAPRPGSAWVAVGTRHVLARNALNVRAPPASRVIVARDPHRLTWVIVGRER